MKKLLFLMIAIMGVGFYMRGGFGPDSNTRGAGFGLPTLGIGQASTVISMIMAAVHPGAGQQAANAPRTAPVMPNVTSVNGTYNAATNSGATAAAGGSSSFAVPPELTRFMNPSLLTSNPAGTQNLSPQSQAALQQIIAQARANPAAFKEQLNAVAKQIGASH